MAWKQGAAQTMWPNQESDGAINVQVQDNTVDTNLIPCSQMLSLTSTCMHHSWPLDEVLLSYCHG